MAYEVSMMGMVHCHCVMQEYPKRLERDVILRPNKQLDHVPSRQRGLIAKRVVSAALK